MAPMQMSRPRHWDRQFSPRFALAALACIALPAFAQTSAVEQAHDAHAMHSPVKTKQDSAGEKAKPAASAHADHPDHAMEKGAVDVNDDHAAMDHGSHQGMDHAPKVDDVAGLDHGTMPDHDMATMDHGSMKMQGGSAPADARDPDYSDGVAAAHMHDLHKHGELLLGSVIVDQLEIFNGDGSHGQSIDAQAWYGGDIDKLWFKLDGERSEGRLGASRMEALWNRAISAYWDTQAGFRHDLGEGPSRDWVAFGVQGLAPYWFNVEATAYVGESGRTALRLEAEYELLLTQRLILQPDVEVNFYGKNDPARGIGSGLSDIDVGLRLRYEFTRKFAPYIGVSWSRKFGPTADFAGAEGRGADDTQLVAGVRLWF